MPDPATLKADPENLLFGRMNRRRLEAEAIRDACWPSPARSTRRWAGPSVRDLNSPRRTLYLMTIRSDRSSFGSLFDAADPTAMVDKRIDSTVAPQALFLLNNPFAARPGQGAGGQVRGEATAGRRAARIDRLYRLLYGRPADGARGGDRAAASAVAASAGRRATGGLGGVLPGVAVRQRVHLRGLT